MRIFTDKNGNELEDGDVVEHPYAFGNHTGVVDIRAAFILYDRVSGYCEDIQPNECIIVKKKKKKKRK